MKRFFMKAMLALFFLLLLWIIIAPGCMTFRKSDAVMKKQFQQHDIELFTFTKNINGHKLHYAKTGNDTMPTILFVHGTPGSWDAFAGYLRDSTLLQHYRMVSIDRPGFGYSDFGDVFHLKDQAVIINPLIKDLQNGKPFFLAGHSLGGPLLVKLAADDSTLISAIVLIAGSIDPAQEKPEKWRPVIFKTPLNLLVPGALKPSNKELWYLKDDLVNLKQDFDKIHCPIVLVHGTKDQLVPFENTVYAKKMFANAVSISELYFPGENHFIPWTKFDEIKTLLLNLNKLL